MPIPTRKEVDAKKQEINNLYGKLSEVESGLKEEKKINARLKGDLATKTQQLLSLEQSIVAEQETYRWSKSDTLTSLGVIRSEGGARVLELDTIAGDMSVDMAEHDWMEEENLRLHQRLKLLAMEHYQASIVQKEERELRKQKSFDTRATMEQILRRTLKEVDLEYMLKANDKMDHEANWARIENAKLKKEAGKRQENCATLVQEQKDSYEVLVMVKVQKDVLLGMASRQEDSSKLAQAQVEDIKNKNEDLEEKAKGLRVGIESLTMQLNHKKRLQVELGKLKTILARAEAKRKSICKAVVLTCRKSVSRGLDIALKDNKRKGAKLTKGFQNLSGDPNPAREGAGTGAEEVKQSLADDDRSVGTAASASTYDTGVSTRYSASTTFMNDEDVMIRLQHEAQEAEVKAIADAEAAWNSSRSDVHVATRLRLEIRKMRRRELRERLLQDAAAGYSKATQNGKSASTTLKESSIVSGISNRSVSLNSGSKEGSKK